MQNNTFSGGFVGRNLITLTSVPSTNDYLKEELSKSTPLTEGTVILAVHQTAGRGQMGAIWVSEPGQNLTFSLLLNPVSTAPSHQFAITIVVSLALIEFLQRLLPDHLVQVKWPNDIYVEGRKIAGILIENIISGRRWKHSIIGVGLNVNQTVFPEGIREKVTSMRLLTGEEYELTDLLAKLCAAIESNYEGMELSATPWLLGQYVKNLYRYNEEATYLIDGVPVRGKIVGVTVHGRLQLDFNGHVVDFGIREVEFSH